MPQPGETITFVFLHDEQSLLSSDWTTALYKGVSLVVQAITINYLGAFRDQGIYGGSVTFDNTDNIQWTLIIGKTTDDDNAQIEKWHVKTDYQYNRVEIDPLTGDYEIYNFDGSEVALTGNVNSYHRRPD